MPATALIIDAVRHTSVQGWEILPTSRRPYAELMVEFEVREPGPAHVCGIHYTTDMWNTRRTAYAECVRLDGPYRPGGVEKWAAHVLLDSHVDAFEYVVFCLDHSGGDQVKEVVNTNGGKLHRVRPAMRSVVRHAGPPPARASALSAREELTGHGAAVRAMDGIRALDVLPATPAERLTAAPAAISHDAIVPYVQMLMMRNFATNTWRFKADNRISEPGCIIASPSRRGDPDTDQDYVNSWVRDSALCAIEAASAQLPWDRTDLLDDYVAFSRITQRHARQADRAGYACFLIDGTVRPDWTVQSDGPALRTLAAIEFYDRLSEAGRADARALVEEDVAYLLSAYDRPTTNLWEETHGLHFFTRAVQKRCLEVVARRHAELGIAVDLAGVQTAATRIDQQLEEHWFTDPSRGRSFYRATVGGAGRGDTVDSSTLMGAVYGGLAASRPRLLATAAVIWDSFRTLYNINHFDHTIGIGPMIGRYPEDLYDGDNAEPNVGHPWPLCTALFAEFYYRVAGQLMTDGQLVVDDLTARFFEQIDVTPGPGTYAAGSPQFAIALGKLREAGDRMLDSVIFHSDHLELSEQYDRHTGYQKSVRNLTWSYAAYLGAVRTRRALPAHEI